MDCNQLYDQFSGFDIGKPVSNYRRFFLPDGEVSPQEFFDLRYFQLLDRG